MKRFFKELAKPCQSGSKLFHGSGAAGHRGPASRTHAPPGFSPVDAKRAEVEQKAEEVRAAKAQVKALKKEAKACRKELTKAKKQQKKQRRALDGEVTGHLDLDEKSVQKPGTSALKTWKVKNTGSMAWPEDTIAIFRAGNRSLIQSG